jgi:hypothetical protein
MLWNGNECENKKQKNLMTISRQPFPVKLKIDQNNCRLWDFLNI